MAKRLELIIANGALAGRRFSVKDGGLRLGRSSSNDIHVMDEELSRNHCLFEKTGDDGLRVTDLASANGTVLNGKTLGSDPEDLKAGDVIEVGSTRIQIVVEGEEPRTASESVDLGFGPSVTTKSTVPALRSRSPLSWALWGVAAVLAAAAAYLLVIPPPPPPPPSEPPEDPTVVEFSYEKVEANAEGIFRYELMLSRDDVLRVAIDDVPKEDRHLTKSLPLGEAAMKAVNEILAFKVVKEIDREYAGPEPDQPSLSSLSLKVVYATRARMIRIVNTPEPEAFRAIREKLEAFSKNELGVWAIQYSRDKLIRLAEEAVTLGKAKYEERDVNYGNLAASVAAFREAIFYLETVNPKPACDKEAREGHDVAVKELDRRYADQRFVADRACNLGQWETARRELGILLEMVPDRADDRNREATAKLLDVEKRIQKGAK